MRTETVQTKERALACTCVVWFTHYWFGGRQQQSRNAMYVMCEHESYAHAHAITPRLAGGGQAALVLLHDAPGTCTRLSAVMCIGRRARTQVIHVTHAETQ